MERSTEQADENGVRRNDAFFLVDVFGEITSWGVEAERITGYKAQELIGRSVAELEAPEERDGHVDALRGAAGRGEAVRWEGWTVRKDGGRFRGSYALSPVRDLRGEVSGFVGHLRDGVDTGSSPRRATAPEEPLIDLLLRGMQEYAIFLIDLGGRIERWSAAAERLLGYSEEEAIGMPYAALWVDEEGKPGAAEAGRELDLAATKGHACDDRWHVRKDGTHFWANGVTSALRDREGGLRGFAKVLADRTERKRLEEELRLKAEALEEADRGKTEFLAMLAHELRNPLSPIASAISLLQLGDGLAADDAEAVAIADRQVKKLTRLIDDLMDVSRIARGKFQLHRQPVDLRTIVDGAIAAARPLLEEHRHELATRMPDGPVTLLADATRLEQVFENLLVNACKYTPTGGRIEIALERADGAATVRVSDNGVGIAPELLPRIFELFTQADRSIDRSQGGLGIGLTIVKTLVELHHGSVDVATGGLGRGSEFTVRLPISSDGALERGEAETSKASGVARRILVVEDNADAAKMLAMTLRMEGHEVETALCGFRALEMAKAFRPDAILLDIALPGLDGYEVARRLRENASTRDIALIAVTGYGQPEDRERSRAAGFERHLVKPVRSKDVLEALRTLNER